MKFLGIRHGQSEYNLRGLCNDDPKQRVPLTKLGRQQAHLAAEKLDNAQISRIYCSPLLRTIQTAQIINNVIQRPLKIEPRLRDIHTGFDSLPVATYLDFIADDPLHARVEGCESLSDHFVRVSSFLEELQGGSQKLVLLVVHEETLRVFKAWSENSPLLQVLGLPFGHCQPFEFDNTIEQI